MTLATENVNMAEQSLKTDAVVGGAGLYEHLHATVELIGE